MKNRSQCKLCGATGVIRTPKKNGHFIHGVWKMTEKGEYKYHTNISLGNDGIAECPKCEPDKY